MVSKKRKIWRTSDVDAGRTSKKARRQAAIFQAGTSQPAGNLQHAVLSRYFPRVVTLRKYLLAKIPLSRHKHLANIDLASHKRDQWNQFLDETLIGFVNENSTLVEKARHQDFIAFTQDPQRSSKDRARRVPEHQIEEIVDFVIWSLFHKTATTSFRPKHILCHGYQRTIAQKGIDRTPATAQRIQGLVLEQPNQNVQALKQPPWTELLDLLGNGGNRTMQSLLLDCAIFLRLPAGKDNYYQLSGVPISDIPLLKFLPEVDPKQPPTKTLTASHVSFARHRILYAKPSLNSKGDVRFAMKHDHVLNLLQDSMERAQTVRIMEQIFPRQFGLHNVFTCNPNGKSTAQGFKDYTSRRTEINVHVKKFDNAAKDQAIGSRLPRRLRGALQDLVRKIQRNHKKCSYAQLLRYYTSQAAIYEARPRTNPSARNQPTEPAIKTQVIASTPSNTVTVSGSIREAAKASRGSIMQYATPDTQVSAFCIAVLLHLLPRDAFGTGPDGTANWNIFRKWVNHFITMRRNETLNLHTVIQGIKIGAVPWLEPPKLASLKMSVSDRGKRWEIFHEFVYFTFDSLLIPLIRSNFFVTESAVHRSRLFYFRHDVWRKISEPTLAQLKLTLFEEVALERTGQALGHSTIRLLPKMNGIRVIANLKKKIVKSFKGKMVLSNGINKQLEPVFDVLNYERSQQPLMLGSSIFSSNEVHGRLKQFKSSLRGQKLYFVKLDIKSCFDSIPQEGLVELAETLLRENQYRIHTHAEIKGDEEKMSRKFPRKALTVTEDAVFCAGGASALASDRKRTVFASTGNFKVQKTEPLLNMLREHITSNTVKIGRKHYRQKNGIPQGSILSSLLCSFFYGAFEAENLSFLDERSMLVRLIDDFLLITTEPAAAQRFLDVMASGNPKYGITVQSSKSLTNFDAAVNGQKIPRLHGTTAFPYIGLTIDTSTLSVAKERASKDPEVRNGLTVQLKQAGCAFRTKVLHSLKIQMLGMVLDTQLSSTAKVLTNLYQCFTEVAMKMCRYVDAMTTKPSAGLVVSVLEESVSLAFNLMRQQSRAREKVGYQCDVSKLQTEWVASTAVQAVLRKKQSRYGQVLTWAAGLKLRTEPGIKIDQKTRRLVIDEGSRGFKGYVY